MKQIIILFKKAIQISFVIFLSVALFISCTKEEISDKLVDPSNANELSEVLIMPTGTKTVDGQPPLPSGQGAPTVSNPNSSVLASNGSTAPLYYNYSYVQGNLGGCYVQVDGASRYFNIPYGSNSGTNGSLSLPLGLPTNVDEGEFCVNFSVYDASGRVSNTVTTCV